MPLPTRLEVIHGADTRVVEVPPTGLEIGRAPGLGLTIDSPAISKRHARLSWDGDDLILTDLGATNRARKGGEPISGPTQLVDGDEVVLGDVLLRVLMESPGFGYPLSALDDDRSLKAAAAPPVPPVPALEQRAATLLPVVETFFHARDLRGLGQSVVDAVASVFRVSRIALLDLESGGTRFRVLGLGGTGPTIPSGPGFVSRTVVLEAVRRGVALYQLGAVGRGNAASLVEAKAMSAVASLLRCRGDRQRVLYVDTTAEDLGRCPLLTWQQAYELQMFSTYATSAMDGLASRDEGKLEELKLETLRRHLAPATAAALVSTGDAEALSAPRSARAVVLRADLVGFLALVDAHAGRPAVALELLDRWLEAATTAIFAAGGTLEGFAGDTVTAVFGSPQPVRDATATAVGCGRALVLAARELAASTRQPLHAAIGVELGDILSGHAGPKRHREYMVVGPAVAVATSASQALRAGVVVGPAAAVELKGLVELAPLPGNLFRVL